MHWQEIYSVFKGVSYKPFRYLSSLRSFPFHFSKPFPVPIACISNPCCYVYCKSNKDHSDTRAKTIHNLYLLLSCSTGHVLKDKRSAEGKRRDLTCGGYLESGSLEGKIMKDVKLRALEGHCVREGLYKEQHWRSWKVLKKLKSWDLYDLKTYLWNLFTHRFALWL